MSVSLNRSELFGTDLRRVQAVQQQVHLREQIRQRLWLRRRRCCASARLAVSHGFELLVQMIERFDEKAAGAAGRVEQVSPSRGSVTATMKRTTARGV